MVIRVGAGMSGSTCAVLEYYLLTPAEIRGLGQITFSPRMWTLGNRLNPVGEPLGVRTRSTSVRIHRDIVPAYKAALDGK